jgi:hypothetical protein
MVMSKADIEKEKRLDRVKTVAGQFADLIIKRHIEWRKSGVDYDAESLLKGTPYEGVVIASGTTVVYIDGPHQYVWLYIPRDGDETANLKEFSGFI